MKKQLLALAIGSMVVAPSLAMADEGPTVYGKVNVTYGVEDDGTNDAWNLDSNASRLGIKGALDLDFENVTAIYQAEYQISVDEGSGPFSQRNIYGGFQHANAGTLIAGNFDSPLKKAQGKIDQFNDLNGDIGAIFAGEERLKNIVQYSSPKLADAVTLNLAFIPGEEAGTDNDGPADAFSGSVVFDNKMFYAALAYDSDVMSGKITDAPNSNKIKTDTLRAGVMAKINNFEIGGLFQTSENSESLPGGDVEDTAYLVSGAVSLDRLKLKAQYGMVDQDAKDDDVTLLAIGADYKVASASKVFTYYSMVEADKGTQDDSYFGVGFEHKFSM